MHHLFVNDLKTILRSFVNAFFVGNFNRELGLKARGLIFFKTILRLGRIFFRFSVKREREREKERERET